MTQVNPAPNPVLYAECEYQKAKDILANSLVSLDSRESYYTRFALWIHYCNKHHGGNDVVTGSRVADYVEWLVGSEIADGIRHNHPRLQQMLRGQVQGVRYYWSLQNNGGGVDPLQSKVFRDRWRSIVERYPCHRLLERAELGESLSA
ncbi:hypothetical protein GGI06_000657 [Coemansia sp. S85]|nr:hypothetical protein GGI06_000657 [Coemansia sp. S85]